MTTIAYRDGVLAADTLQTANGARDGTVTKIMKVGPLLVGASGRSACCEAFRSWVKGGMADPSPINENFDANGMIVMPDDTIVVWSEHGCWRLRSSYYALGSGYQFATGAMAMGANAVQAIAVASEFDTSTGGEITALRR